MQHLLVTFISIENGFLSSILDYCGLIVLLAGISVIIIKNPIGSLIALIAVYGFISIFLMFIGLTFIGFSYIIVYIGAVSILFLFILMLIDIRTSELQTNNWNSIPLASSIVIFLNYVLVEGLPETIKDLDSIRETAILWIKSLFYFDNTIISLPAKNLSEIMYATSYNWDTNMTETSHISSIGNILYTSYNMWLFITSIILLLAMVGAIIITIKSK